MCRLIIDISVILEIKEKRDMDNQRKKFILHWGEMGAKWGISRVVAQIHAILFTSVQPMDAQAISEELSIARSNVSTALKELQTWEVVRVVHVLGDRKEHFEATKDVWEMCRTILSKRVNRELLPTLSLLKELEPGDTNESSHFVKQCRDLRDLLESFMTVHEMMMAVPLSVAKKLLREKRRFKTLFGKG